jgi:hypothetical protein
MSDIIDIYKNLRNKINSLEGEFVLSEENIDLINKGVEFGIVSNDIIFEGKTHQAAFLISNTKNATVTIIPKTPPGLIEFYISDSSENFFTQFNRYYKIPKNLYVYEIYSKEGFNEIEFISKLNFSIKVRDIIDIIADHKKKDDAIYEYFIYAANPLVIVPNFNEYDFIEKIKEADEVLSFINSDLKKN